MIKVDKDSKYFMCEECSLVYIDNNSSGSNAAAINKAKITHFR